MHPLKSHFLLTVQLVSFLFIIMTGPLVAQEFTLIFAQLFALGFITWGILTLRKRSELSPFPEVKKNAKLITDGPFEYVRHPIYSGMLLFALLLVISYFTFPRAVALLLLTLVLLLKLHLEEVYLTKHFTKYEEYQKNSKKIIPFVY